MTGTQGGSSKPPEWHDRGTSAGEYAGVGLQMAICIVGGLYLGQWLDRKFGTAPWLLMIGVFGGAALSFYSMYRKLMAGEARDRGATPARRDGTEP
jgi:F0F1-type ATP synthase assembly protein I